MTPSKKELQGRLASLRQDGNYLYPKDRPTVQLVGVHWRSEDGREHPITLDVRGVAGVDHLYAEPDLRRALAREHIGSATIGYGRGFIEKQLTNHGLIWGFSGYASPGHPYSDEARAISTLLDSPRQRNRPSLVSSGGVGAGVPGLSAVIAQMRGIPTIGFLPRAGLEDIGPHSHLVVRADTYQQREQLVGALPDILVCVGGSDGTRRELEWALGYGSVVIMIVPPGNQDDPKSPIATYHQIPGAAKALEQQRLLIVRLGREDESISAAAAQAIAGAREWSSRRRRHRLETLRALL